MTCKQYEADKALRDARTKELGSLEYQCRTCRLKCRNMLKVARTHFEACRDYERKADS